MRLSFYSNGYHLSIIYYLNVVVLILYNCEDEIQAMHIKIYIWCSTCRMNFIQRALERGVSPLSNARFLNNFEAFPAFVGGFEAKKFIKSYTYTRFCRTVIFRKYGKKRVFGTFFKKFLWILIVCIWFNVRSKEECLSYLTHVFWWVLSNFRHLWVVLKLKIPPKTAEMPDFIRILISRKHAQNAFYGLFQKIFINSFCIHLI